MPNKYALRKNTNNKSTAFGKYYATPVYDQGFVSLDKLAEFIQTQASVKRSDVKAVIDELGYAIQHFLGMGQKVKVEGLGIFKPTVRCKGCESLKDFEQAKYLTGTKLLFSPETKASGRTRIATCLQDVTWEMAEVAVDSNGAPLAVRAAVRAAKEEAEQQTQEP